MRPVHQFTSVLKLMGMVLALFGLFPDLPSIVQASHRLALVASSASLRIIAIVRHSMYDIHLISPDGSDLAFSSEHEEVYSWYIDAMRYNGSGYRCITNSADCAVLAILETIESLGCKYVIKGKGYPTLVEQVIDPSVVFVTSEEGRETTELVTALNTWGKGRRFVVSRVLKDEKDRKQISFLESEAYDFFFIVTNTELSPDEVVEFYKKRGNRENYIKEAKYYMAVGHLLLQSFWVNEAIFQLKMLAFNLFLMFKMGFAKGTEYRQQIKTFRLKYNFLAGKIIRTARRVVMKLSEKYPYREIFERGLP